MMPEVAWLSFLRGEWLLVTGSGDKDLRKWADRELAFRDLENEGWTIAPPAALCTSSARRRLKRRLLGYRLRRTVH